MHQQRTFTRARGPGFCRAGSGALLAPLAAAFLVAACQSSGSNPKLKSTYVGQSSAAFFEAYGPPDQVIGLEQKMKKDSTGKIVKQTDPKELVYYWSSARTAPSKVSKPTGDVCNLAILTSAEGKILRIEVQDENGDIATVKAKCEALIK
ncbi:hypothetical protein [Roseibium sediminicola]|uniref:Lipoprotein n=1 Tax=Roseibium sediminicola TaxID=2933272 RepID=A0ABT0GVP7_9HYPH|nr:hypothetical protein [Roseibium sp. CAU 1639]MCK7613290.1 hypothetical protein [Roseibium sp. CAU 1639]